MVYVILLPFLYFGRSVKLYFQPSASVTFFVAYMSPSARRFTVIFPGLLPSWSFASFQVFVPSILIVSGVWLLVNVYPFSASPVTAVVYSETASSVTSYVISDPSAYLGRSVKLNFQSFAAVTSRLLIFVPFAIRLTVILGGLIPSWFSPSSQILTPFTDVVSGV